MTMHSEDWQGLARVFMPVVVRILDAILGDKNKEKAADEMDRRRPSKRGR